MQTSIPEILNFAAQPLDMQGRLYQSVTLTLGFDLVCGNVLAPQSTFAAAMQALQGGIFDTGLPKKEAEWLLAGHACAPEGSTCTSLVVDLRLAQSHRRLLVECDRPVSSLPLTWANTWGNPEENPEGLPHTHLSRAPVCDADSPFGTPACPAPRGAWPCRMKNMGTYDAAWLTTRWPGLPDDCDWSFANLAQPVQRLKEGLTGGEDYVLTHVHPSLSPITGRLPEKTLRLFVQRKEKLFEHALILDTVFFFPNQLVGLLLWHALIACSDESATDILELSVTISPEENAEEALETESSSQDAASPPLDAPPGITPLTLAEPKLVSPKVPAPPEMPAGCAETQKARPEENLSSDAFAAKLSQNLDEHLDEINEGLAEAGLPPLSAAQLSETREKLSVLARQLADREKTVHTAPEEDLLQLFARAGLSKKDLDNINTAFDLPLPKAGLCRTKEEWHRAIESYLQRFAGLMHPSEGTLNSMRTILRLQGPDAEELLPHTAPMADPGQLLQKAGFSAEGAARYLELLDGDIPSDPEGLKAFSAQLEQAAGLPRGAIHDKILAVQEQLQKLGLTIPSTPPPARNEADAPAREEDAPKGKISDPAMPSADETNASLPKPTDREGVLAWLAQDLPLRGCDLRGCDLSHLDLSHCDLSQCNLIRANLTGTRLYGADLTAANLTEAHLTACDLSEARLTCATLTRAEATQTLFVHCDLSGASAPHLFAPEADFSESVLEGCDFSEGNFQQAVFTHTKAGRCTAARADFSSARLRFCDLRECDLRESTLTACDLHDCVLSNAKINKAVLDRASLCSGTDLSHADCQGASLNESVLSEVVARGTNFAACVGQNVCCTDSDLTCAILRQSDLRFGDFSRTEMAGADLEGVNLFKGSLREANLCAARITCANLYGVDMTRAVSDPGTNFDKSLLSNTIYAARQKT